MKLVVCVYMNVQTVQRCKYFIRSLLRSLGLFYFIFTLYTHCLLNVANLREIPKRLLTRLLRIVCGRERTKYDKQKQ